MKAQAYFDGDTIIRIFIRGLWAADLPLNPEDCSDSAMDRALRRLRLRRRGPWRETDWGAEATLRFIERKAVKL